MFFKNIDVTWITALSLTVLTIVTNIIKYHRVYLIIKYSNIIYIESIVQFQNRCPRKFQAREILYRNMDPLYF